MVGRYFKSAEIRASPDFYRYADPLSNPMAALARGRDAGVEVGRRPLDSADVKVSYGFGSGDSPIHPCKLRCGRWSAPQVARNFEPKN